MEAVAGENLVLILRPATNEFNDSSRKVESNVQNKQLRFEVKNFKLEERNQIYNVVTRSRSIGRSCKKKLGFGARAMQAVVDMTISRSCQYRLSIPVMFWTTVFLILLARGVNSFGDEQSRFSRSPKYKQDADIQGGSIPSNAILINSEAPWNHCFLHFAGQNFGIWLGCCSWVMMMRSRYLSFIAVLVSAMQETYNVILFLRELLQRQQQRANQQLQFYNKGGDLNDNQIDWRKVPLPLLHQIRSIISDGSKEEDKRGSYMSLCHFKICNLG